MAMHSSAQSAEVPAPPVRFILRESQGSQLGAQRPLGEMCADVQTSALARSARVPAAPLGTGKSVGDGRPPEQPGHGVSTSGGTSAEPRTASPLVPPAAVLGPAMRLGEDPPCACPASESAAELGAFCVRQDSQEPRLAEPCVGEDVSELCREDSGAQIPRRCPLEQNPGSGEPDCSCLPREIELGEEEKEGAMAAAAKLNGDSKEFDTEDKTDEAEVLAQRRLVSPQLSEENIEDSCREEVRHWKEMAEELQQRSQELSRGAAAARRTSEQGEEVRRSLEEALESAEGEKKSMKARLRQQVYNAESFLVLDRRETQLEEAHLCLARQSEAKAEILEEQSARWFGEVEKAQERFEDLRQRTMAELESSLRKAQDEIASRDREETLSRLEAERQRPRTVLGRCAMRGGSSESESQTLYADLRFWTEEAEREAAEACKRAEDTWSQQRCLEDERRKLQEGEEALKRISFEEGALETLREERTAEERAATMREERLEAETIARSERREQAVGDSEEVQSFMSDVPLAVRIPRFEVIQQGITSAQVNYTIVLQGPGATDTIRKQFSEFKELHEALSSRPFAMALQALPYDWLFAHFSMTMLERRRSQLEVYLSSICAHASVLLDPVLWNWLGADELTQMVVRLVVAWRLRRPVRPEEEVCRLVQALEALVERPDGCRALARCAHPAVLEVLRGVLDENADGNHNSPLLTAAACSLLERLLVGSARARQLFFLPLDRRRRDGATGASALVAACRGKVPRHSTTNRMVDAAAAPDESSEAAAAQVLLSVLGVLCQQDNGEDAEKPRPEAKITLAGTRLREGGALSEADVSQAMGECCICLDRARSHALLPCGHLCACMDCAAFLAARASPCPVCRRVIESSVQIFV